jgi:hypothetical protein
MRGRFFLRVLLGMLVIAGIIGIGAYAYHVGVVQGAAQGVAAATAPVGPFYGHPFHPFGGLGCFGLLIPLFLLMIIFGALRAMFWRGRWGHMHRHWHEGHPGWENRVPPFFEEWHKRAHEPKPDAPAETKLS